MSSSDSFTITETKLTKVLLSRIGVFQHGFFENKITESVEQLTRWKALWDTGATTTVITPNVVKGLSLSPVSIRPVHTPNGSYNANVFYVDLLLPNGVRFKKLKVIDGIPIGCDALIGMDIIGLGDFAVSNYNGMTSFTFRIPSIEMIDFTSVKQSTMS